MVFQTSALSNMHCLISELGQSSRLVPSLLPLLGNREVREGFLFQRSLWRKTASLIGYETGKEGWVSEKTSLPGKARAPSRPPLSEGLAS